MGCAVVDVPEVELAGPKLVCPVVDGAVVIPVVEVVCPGVDVEVGGAVLDSAVVDCSVVDGAVVD